MRISDWSSDVCSSDLTHLESGNPGSSPGQALAGATARQARAGAEEADLVLFVVDGREGASALDDDILRWLRKAARPTFLVVNKTDGIAARAARVELSERKSGEGGKGVSGQGEP